MEVTMMKIDSVGRLSLASSLLFWAVSCDHSGAGPISSAGGSGSGGERVSSGGAGSGGDGSLSTGGASVGGSLAGSGGEVGLSGGAAGAQSGGAPSGGSASFEGKFELLFRDDFNSFDDARWGIMTHSWDSNIALFSSESVSVENGELSITLLDAPEGTTDGTNEKQFLGAEVRSTDAITYGRVTARAKMAKGSAVVSSLVTIYTPWPADNWNELDIECLGKDPTQFQSNAMVYTGVLPATKTPVSPTMDDEMHSFGFDASAEFHEYTIEWTPESARFLVDGELVREWTARIALMNLPQNILLTIWASNVTSWVGPVDATTTGAKAVYDWVEVYEYL